MIKDKKLWWLFNVVIISLYYITIYYIISHLIFRIYHFYYLSIRLFSSKAVENNNSNKEPKFKYIKYYEYPSSQRDMIRKDNNGKIGVYAWFNKINGKIYIGSGNPLYLRISDYYQKGYLESRTNLSIVRALNKYGMINFSLIILEYTESENVIFSEQEWIDKLNPEYNINPVAGNSKGYKHKLESIDKMRNAALGRLHTDEVKLAMSESRKNENNPFYGKKHSLDSIALMKSAAALRKDLPVPGIEVEVTDLTTKITTIYDSIRKAASAIDSDIKTILRREKIQNEKGINMPYRNRYVITIKRP